MTLSPCAMALVRSHAVDSVYFRVSHKARTHSCCRRGATRCCCRMLDLNASTLAELRSMLHERNELDQYVLACAAGDGAALADGGHDLIAGVGSALGAQAAEDEVRIRHCICCWRAVAQ